MVTLPRRDTEGGAAKAESASAIAPTPLAASLDAYKRMVALGKLRAFDPDARPPSSSSLSPRERERLETRTKDLEGFEKRMRKDVADLYDAVLGNVPKGAGWKKVRPRAVGENLEARLTFLSTRWKAFARALFELLGEDDEDDEDMQQREGCNGAGGDGEDLELGNLEACVSTLEAGRPHLNKAVLHIRGQAAAAAAAAAQDFVRGMG